MKEKITIDIFYTVLLIVVAFLLWPSDGWSQEYAIDQASIEEGLKDCYELKAEVRLDLFGVYRMVTFAEKVKDNCFDLEVNEGTTEIRITYNEDSCFVINHYVNSDIIHNETLCND